MHFASLFIFLCLLLTAFYIIGLLLFLTDHEPDNNCEMTYMFEYPQYIRISQKIDGKYPKYGLYVYGEGRITKKARNMQFNGIPVLFICGNAGSHKQVRSLASIALRKTLNSGTSYHFDYFSVDLNNEFSALYGPLLYEQFDYITHSLNKILELYNGVSKPPQKIVLIGHSMGGVIAKRITSLLYDQKLISLLITLASPLKRNVIYFDRYGSKFYKSISSQENNFININIAGGYSDFLVPSFLSNLKGNNTLNLVTSNIPKSWVEANHVQILWCKQTIMAINRALFDSVDLKTLQVSSNVSFIADVFRHHLLQNSGGKVCLKKGLTNLDTKGEWIASIKKQYTIEHSFLRQNYWYMVSLTALPAYEKLTILTVNLETSNWIFACNAAYPKGHGRVCKDGDDLTSYSEIVPSIRHKRRLITINLHEIQKNNSEYTHVVFRSLPTSEPVTFHVDIYGTFERTVEFALPNVPFIKKTIVSKTPEKAVSFELIFPGLVNVIQSYQLYVEPIKCSNNKHHASASLIVPWANEMVHTYITESLDKPFILRLQNAKPTNASDARVRLILEPSCLYKISIKRNFLGTFANLARYYSPFLLTHSTVVFLLVFQNQIHQLSKTGKFPLFFTSLFNIINYSWLIIIMTGVVSKILSHTIGIKFLPEPDIVSFPNDGNWIDFLLLPLFLHMVSIIFVFVLVSVFAVSLFTLESTVNKLTLKFLAKTVTLTLRFSDYFMTFLQKVPFIVSSVLIFLCFTTCGGLALCVGMVFYFLKLTKMSQDYVEQITWFLLKTVSKKLKSMFSKRHINETEVIADTETIAENNESTAVTKKTDSEEPNRQNIFNDIFKTNNSLFFHSSMFFIWFTVMVLNIPAVLTWAHNFKFSRHLSRDESFLPGLFFSVSAALLWQFDLPSNNRRFADELRLMTLYCTIIILIYGTISVYVVNYLLTILFVLVVLQQYHNIIQNESSSSNNAEDTKRPEEIYDEMRMKLD